MSWQNRFPEENCCLLPRKYRTEKKMLLETLLASKPEQKSLSQSFLVLKVVKRDKDAHPGST